MAHSQGAIRVTCRQRRLAVRVRRHPKGPGKSIDVVRRPVLLWVCRGPFLPPVVMDQERRLMFSRTPGKMRKLLRNVRGMDAPSGVRSPTFDVGCVSLGYPDSAA